MNLSKSEASKLLKKIDKINDYQTKINKEFDEIKSLLSGATSSSEPPPSRRRGTPKRRAKSLDDDTVSIDD